MGGEEVEGGEEVGGINQGNRWENQGRGRRESHEVETTERQVVEKKERRRRRSAMNGADCAPLCVS